MPSLAYPTVNVSGAIIQLNRSYGHMATSSLNADDQRSNPPSISDVSRICCSISYDSITIAARGDGDHLGNHVVQFNFSARDENDHVLENFETQLVLDLLPRALTQGERLVLLSFGLVHANYLQLPLLPVVQKLKVRAGYLSPAQLSFFQDNIFPGALAEYAHLAGLDAKDMIQLECCVPHPADSDVEYQGPATVAADVYAPTTAVPPARPRVLVPFGGGKDSTLLMELLHACGADVAWCYMGEWEGSWKAYSKFERLAEASPSQTVFKAEQRLPCLERLQQLNQRPRLHFPDYVAYVSFYTLTAAFFALQHGYEYICVGNEHSANEINLVDPKYGFELNHQWEKSFAAEQLFHRFLKDHVSPRLYYFSGLQHMSELEIAARFVSLCADKYLGLIVSCNWATDDNWCGACEKCAFVYILFSAFLDSATLRARVFTRTGQAAAALGSNGHSTCSQAGDNTITAGCSDACSCGHHHQKQQEQGQQQEQHQQRNTAGPSSPQPATVSDGRGGLVSTPAAASSSEECMLQDVSPSAVPVTQVASSLSDHEEPFSSLDHLPLFEGLMGVRGHKPLECVGTPAEVLAALYLAYCRHYSGYVLAADQAGQAVGQGASAPSELAVDTSSSDPSHKCGGIDGSVATNCIGAAEPSALPMLFQKHLQLITTRGAAEWEAIRASMAAADAGHVEVPTLYPPWYQLPRLPEQFRSAVPHQA